MGDEQFTVAVFPFLKTSRPVAIGGYTFRSTSDVADLSEAQAVAVSEIAKMLFVKDDLRMVSASYAVVPYINFHSPSVDYFRLAFLRSIVAYLYSAPHDVFGDVFFAPEEVSLVLLSPERVSEFLVSPEHHTESVAPGPKVESDSFRTIPGYYGVYNFRHHFWAARHSRIYGLKPQMRLNINQDLQIDFEVRLAGRHEIDLLRNLINRPLTPTINRIITALHWYNAANESDIDPHRAVLNLAIAFEALLRLPADAKSDRIVDAIALLLGRTERLSDWAQQFYAARSKIAHEGFISDGFYYAPGGKARDPDRRSGSLLHYGRHVFQLCLSTLLVGADLADRAQLREKFIANSERYEEICRLLDDETVVPRDRILRIVPIVASIQRYRFVRRVVSHEAAIGTVRRASMVLLKANIGLAHETEEVLRRLANSTRHKGEFEQLAAIHELHTVYDKLEFASLLEEERVVRNLVDTAWMDLFDRYFRLLAQQRKGA